MLLASMIFRGMERGALLEYCNLAVHRSLGRNQKLLFLISAKCNEFLLVWCALSAKISVINFVFDILVLCYHLTISVMFSTVLHALH